MRRQHPDPRMSIPITLEVWHRLTAASFDSDFKKEDWEIAAEAIDEWMRRHKPDALAMQVAKGYQWKSLFLPTGTLLRTVFDGKNNHCLVEGDQILYNGKAVSPSGFVNAVGGIRRNAWRSTWILFPDSKDWKLADTLRNRARPRRARKSADAVQQTPAPHPAAGHAPVAIPPVATTENPSVATCLQHAIDEQVPRIDSHRERRNRQHRTGSTLSPPGYTFGANHSNNGDEQMAAMLRQELLPLLYRICAFNGMAP
jgi:hypothetical protein